MLNTAKIKPRIKGTSAPLFPIKTVKKIIKGKVKTPILY